MNVKLLNLLADAAATAETTGEAVEMSAGATIIYYAVQFVPLILIFVIFYFMLIRPQRKKDKEAKKMLESLKVGDRICTIGGIYGTIVRIKDDVLTIAADVNIRNDEEREGYVMHERRSGHLERRFSLEGIRQEEITADSRNGVLTVVLPKVKPEGTKALRRIAIGGAPVEAPALTEGETATEA